MRHPSIAPLFADENPSTETGGGTAKDPNTRKEPVHPPTTPKHP